MAPEQPVSVEDEAAAITEPQSASAKVSVEQATERLDEPKGLTRFRLQIGLGVLLGLLFLIVLVLGLVSWFAFETYPEVESVQSTVDKKSNLHKAVTEDRDAWFSNIKDLLQLMLVSLLVPTLTTVIGYIFGRQEGASENEGANA